MWFVKIIKKSRKFEKMKEEFRNITKVLKMYKKFHHYPILNIFNDH